jgi:DNA-binding PadR family transcriptional regulator
MHNGRQDGTPTLTATEYSILRLLANEAARELYGLELVSKSESEGRLKRGTVYVLLNRLEDKGFVESRKQAGDSVIPRRMYRLTGLGYRVLDAWQRLAEIGRLEVAST